MNEIVFCFKLKSGFAGPQSSSSRIQCYFVHLISCASVSWYHWFVKGWKRVGMSVCVVLTAPLNSQWRFSGQQHLGVAPQAENFPFAARAPLQEVPGAEWSPWRHSLDRRVMLIESTAPICSALPKRKGTSAGGIICSNESES